MRLPSPTLLLPAACVLLAWTGQAAATDGPAPAPASIGAVVAAQAPVTLSGDGRWRFAVDAGNVLHRVGMDPSAPSASIALPLSVVTLATTQDGRRVAMVSTAGCVGVIDVDGSRFAPARWLVGEHLPVDTTAWSAAPAARCDRSADEQAKAARWLHDGFGVRVAALSHDGRSLAIRTGIVDLETGRVVARLPAGVAAGRNPLLLGLRFAEGDHQLLALAAPLTWNQGRGNYHADGMLAASWELPSGVLRRLAPLQEPEAAGRARFFGQATSQDVTHWVNGLDDGGAVQPDARRVTSSDRLLAPLWAQPLPGVILGRMRAFPDSRAWPCMEWLVGRPTFLRRDGTLWVDDFSGITQIDPATGHRGRHLAVVRARDVCALTVPAADGAFTWQGDSLSLRPFESVPGAEGDAPRVLDVRPGWHVTMATVRGDRVLAQWEMTPGESAPASAPTPGARVKPVHVAAYDAATGRPLSDVAENDPVDKYDGLDATGRRFNDDVADTIATICQAPPDPRHATWNLRVSDLSSFQGDDCGATPERGRTVFRTGLDLEPAAPASPDLSQFRRQVLAIDGSIGVVQDGQQLRVFDLAGRRELGRIALVDVGAVDSVQLLAAQGVVLVQARDAEHDGKRLVLLSAYSLAPGRR